MLKSKQNLTVTNGLELQDDIVLEEKGKGRKFTSRFIEAGLVHYKDLGNVLITKETLDKFLKTMIGCPVIINHETITDENADDERVGVISDVWYDDNDGWYYCSGIIWDTQAIDLVKNQGWNVSCSYDFVSDNKAGTHNSLDYDMEFTDGEFLHLALVKDPRYERANIVINSKDKQEKKPMDNVLNSLTEFIKDIVNNERKEKDDMDKVDKRKLIDEVAGMLKSAGDDDEIIRTAIKKMEKIAYEGSERDDRDNRKNRCDDERDNERKNRCDDERDNRRDHADDEKEDNCGRRNRKDNKCDDERDNERRNKCDNADKTDKRKLIDEIGGIMKSAGCDDEDIRTVIKKAEEIAYTNSERSRDNKCKNEDEKDREEFEKEKRIADVKNSVDYAEIARRVVNNSSSYEYGTGYISKEDRLKLGENY
jgi:hypothetical protein